MIVNLYFKIGTYLGKYAILTLFIHLKIYSFVVAAPSSDNILTRISFRLFDKLTRLDERDVRCSMIQTDSNMFPKCPSMFSSIQLTFDLSLIFSEYGMSLVLSEGSSWTTVTSERSSSARLFSSGPPKVSRIDRKSSNAV